MCSSSRFINVLTNVAETQTYDVYNRNSICPRCFGSWGWFGWDLICIAVFCFPPGKCCPEAVTQYKSTVNTADKFTEQNPITPWHKRWYFSSPWFDSPSLHKPLGILQVKGYLLVNPTAELHRHRVMSGKVCIYMYLHGIITQTLMTKRMAGSILYLLLITMPRPAQAKSFGFEKKSNYKEIVILFNKACS